MSSATKHSQEHPDSLKKTNETDTNYLDDDATEQNQ